MSPSRPEAGERPLTLVRDTTPAIEGHARSLGNAVRVMRFAAPRLSLRPLRPEDNREYLRLVRLSRPELQRWNPLHQPGESDRDLFVRMLDLTRETEARGTGWRRVVQLTDGRLVGCVNLHSIVRGLEFEADANWWIATPFTRRGYAAEAVRAMLRHALADLPVGLGLARIHAGIAPDNAASIRVAHKAGFVRQPGLRSLLNSDGHWRSYDAYLAVPPDSAPAG